MPRTQARSDYQISIADRQKALRIPKTRLRKIVVGTLTAEQVRDAEISVALVTDEEIHEINREFLAHDFPTDVISFLLDSDSEPQPKPPRGAGRSISGEIVLSTETAIAEARRYGWSPQDECGLYLVHGLLHLCGYDDLQPKEKRLMRSREQDVLGLFGLTPRYLSVGRKGHNR